MILDAPGIAFKIISFFINWRSRLTGIATGDQALFVSRDTFNEIGRFPNQKLMEDVELTKRLKRISKPFCSLFLNYSTQNFQHYIMGCPGN